MLELRRVDLPVARYDDDDRDLSGEHHGLAYLGDGASQGLGRQGGAAAWCVSSSRTVDSIPLSATKALTRSRPLVPDKLSTFSVREI